MSSTINTFEPIYASFGMKINTVATDMMFRSILNKIKEDYTILKSLFFTSTNGSKKK